MSALRLSTTLLFVSSVAHAHDVHGTQIFLDVGRSTVEAEVQIPVSELAIVIGDPLRGARQYVADHLSVDGVPAQAHSITTRSIEHTDFAVIQATLQPISTRHFAIVSDLIDERVISHDLYVLLRSDPWGGFEGPEPRFLGFMHYQRKMLHIDLGVSTVGNVLVTVVRKNTDSTVGVVLLSIALAVLGIRRGSRRVPPLRPCPASIRPSVAALRGLA